MSDKSESESGDQHNATEPEGEQPNEAGDVTPSPSTEQATSHTLPPSRLSRLATGALNAVATAGVATDPMQQTSLKARLRKFIVPIGVLIFLLILFSLFREILLPFILALVIVYLMEPIVSRVGKTEDDPRGIPRWLAVILVYLVFFGVVTTSVILIIPRFVSEIVRFGETVPEEVKIFRTEQLPRMNERVQRVIKDYIPPLNPHIQEEPEARRDIAVETSMAAFEASLLVQHARKQGAKEAHARFVARDLINFASSPEVSAEVVGEPGFEERILKINYSKAAIKRAEESMTLPFSLVGGSWRYAVGNEEPSFRMVPVKGGGFDFYLNDVDVDVEHLDGSGWRVRRVAASAHRGALKPVVSPQDAEQNEHTLHEMLDLEQGLNDLVEEVVTSSNARIASVITYAQELVVGVIQAFVALILTLMVAAFITIDLHAVMNFFRNLIPREHHESYDNLLKEMDRGLSGVVRGQLLICVINGVLTYVGLVILDIKFSLLLAVVAGVLSLIPIFGTILSTVPIVLFGLTDGLMTGVFALMWILGIHFVEANILNPKIIGTSAHIHPVIVIFALLAGESAFGLVGALLAVPTASILLTLFRFFVMRSPSGQFAVQQMDEEMVVNREHGTDGDHH